ncbi:hypothetical protein M409DRAFT_67092 [Zasmidium cellare ATCC 36951]|uniref:Major facilitator superfamily (MFS) profile domain-containing protein n=1 Tax=Zasmidium cellare ATCC 36951 TaxID=1080233 RepID=A0A6A6CJW9_ZASCE|nr:uncharacterized protein M409DRAFT_67092 [Zasmidium cellare ATCC 36951]KAF2165736.1 hypothetical protein M409DRAFT_67092 [Zasmidium cellare ATCC 36951]
MQCVEQTEKLELDRGLAIDPAEEKAVLRKIDRVILPVMALVYFFQYLDKQSINYAAVFGLQEDLGLSGQEFSWAVSLFYFGQLCSEYPAAYLMSRLPIVSFVGVTIIIWGSAEMCLAAAKDFNSLAAARFFLGFAEGAVAPSFMIITSNWYKRSEHPLRVATWVSMFGVSQIVGALVMYGVGQARLSIEPWRVSLFIGIMPRDCATAWFLREPERKLATERLALDRATRDHTTFDKRQLKEALTDPRTIHYASMALFITIPTPITKFSSLVINGFGFSQLQTMLVGLPGGCVAFCLTWIGALGPLYIRNSRCFFGVLLAAVPMLGSILLLALPARMAWGIVGSTWLAGSSAPPLGQAVGLMASNVKGNTKKSVVAAVFFVFYCVGCIVGPQLWQKQDAPRYTKGCITSVTSWGLLIVSFLLYVVLGRRANRTRDKLTGDTDVSSGAISTDSDSTELQDHAFRYTL